VAAIFTALIIFFIVVVIKIIQYNQIVRSKETLQLNGFKTLANQSFKPGIKFEESKVIVLYFSPDCEYCQQEVGDIINHKQLFSNNCIVLISGASNQALKSFCSALHIDTAGNFIVLRDTADVFSKKFGLSAIPTTFLFGSNHKRLFKLEGGRPAALLASLLHNTK